MCEIKLGEENVSCWMQNTVLCAHKVNEKLRLNVRS